ncbi:hypothetical protein BDFG_00234 [Blastomyces dermatitidis ATCC 26199]|nr:hypothetical protein BDFG_00234 [Blastomyces dermatitidis ATCC 26199]
MMLISDIRPAVPALVFTFVVKWWIAPKSTSHRNLCPTDIPSIRGSPLGIFLSRASLRDINEIETCSVESRCTGMMITYTDGAQEIFGQWYESLPSKQTVVYETKNGNPFEKLHFHLSYENGSTALRQVTLFPL